MFVSKEFANHDRRSFQINIGLEEGYGTGTIHTEQEVMDLIGEWMTTRTNENLPVLTGGMLTSGRMVYLHRVPNSTPVLNSEPVVMFVGEVNPLYNGNLTDAEVIRILFSLASFLGMRLNQTRMYFTYRDEIHILQNEKAVHPTDKK